MNQITAPDDPRMALAVNGETVWTGWTEDEVILQRDCPDCEHGLLLYPARFHAACGGSGFLTRAATVAPKETKA